MIAKVIPLGLLARTAEAGPRRLAVACLRRARTASGDTQESLGRALGTSERSVRRAESGRHDTGLLEVALRYPAFARALALELLAVSERAANDESRQTLPAVAGGGSKNRDPSFAGKLGTYRPVLRGGAVVAHRAHNPEVVGSNPALASMSARHEKSSSLGSNPREPRTERERSREGEVRHSFSPSLPTSGRRAA